MGQQLIIDRRKWYRGKGGDNSKLLNEYGMCCLGFLSLAKGYTKDEIAYKSLPWRLPLSELLLPEMTSCYNTENLDSNDKCPTMLSETMARINDDRSLTEPEREAQLTEEFKKIAIDVVFVN